MMRLRGEFARFVRADAGDRRASSEMPARDLASTSSSVDLVERRDRRVRVDVLAEHDGLRRRVAGDRVGVLERQHPPAGRVRARALELVLASAPSARSSSTISRMRVYASTHLPDSRPAESCRIGTSAKAWSIA